MGLVYNPETGQLDEVADDEIDVSNYDYGTTPNLTDAEVEAELDRFREEYKDEIPNMAGFEKEVGAANVKTVTDFLSKYGKRAIDLFKDDKGNLDWTKLLSMAGGAYAASRPSGSTPTGYQGKIPKLTATSNMLTAPPVGRRPGSGGINYGGGTTYRDEKGNVVSSNEKTLEELLKAAEENPFNRPSTYENPSYGRPPVTPTPGGGGIAPTPTPTPGGGGLPDIAPSPNGGASQAPASSPLFTVGGDGTGYVPPKVPLNSMGLPITPSPGEPGSPEAKAAAFEKQQAELQARMASRAAAAASGAPKDEFALSGGVYANFAAGGLAPKGFVVPADVVSHLGNGSSEAGLKLLVANLGAEPIKGEGDGMSDSIPTTIGGKQEARVANEEAVISPEMVKKIGGGDAEKGAKKLYAMMDRVREERTGTTEQGKQIDPNKFMPGGSVQKYQTGGTTVPKTTPAGATGYESSLSNWAGDYVTGMLGQGQALANKPYEAYTGPLTAGASGLQNQAFTQAAGLQTPAAIGQAATTAGGIASLAPGAGKYTPVGIDFGADQAQQYMNPYLQSALNPAMDEARRQADISRMADAGRLTQAGAFGGSRQAIMESEGRRNLMDKQNQMLTSGYSTAFDKAQQQFNADQARKIQEQQFGTTSGLQGLQTGIQGAQAQGQLGALQSQADLAGLSAMSGLGGVQRGIESEGIAADKAQFEEARLNPYKMVQFQQSLLSGLPLAAQSYNIPGQSNLQQFAGGATTIQQLLDILSGKTTATTK